MKKDFVQLIKDIRLSLRGEFKKIFDAGLSNDNWEQLEKLEARQVKMVEEGGYSKTEFDQLMKEYFMDFSSSNSDEWIIRHDPENAQIITSDNLSIT